MFDKKEFVENVIERGLNLNEIIKEAREEIQQTESSSYGVRGAPETRAAGSGEYVRFLGSMGFFLMSGEMPNNISDDEFQILPPLVQHLVDRGDFSPDVLELFGTRGVTG